MKAGDLYISNQGTNLRLTIKAVTKKHVTAVVERRILDRKTAEVSVEQREREIPVDMWHFVEAAYTKEG